MTQIKVNARKCDRCGLTIDFTPHYGQTVTYAGEGSMSEIDLCRPCWSILIDFMDKNGFLG